VFALETGFAFSQDLPPDGKKFVGDFVTFIVADEYAVGGSSLRSPPATTLISRRPSERRSKVAAMRAAKVGDEMPGRTATRNLSRRVKGMTLEATTQASSQRLPVGSRTPSKPSSSTAVAICFR